MDKSHKLIFGLVFYFVFLLLTPLGLFEDWIPPLQHTGYYSVTKIDPGDDTGYYAYLRSGFFDGDWDFINEPNYAHIERFNETGYVFTNWQVGQSILFLPFFLVGHALAVLLDSLGFSVSVDGNSTPYFMATAIASQTWVFIGLLVLYNFLRKFYSRNTAIITSLASWLGSCLLYYTFIRQRMAHGTEFCFSVIFLWAWYNWRTSLDWRHHAWIGVTLGFLVMIRLINAPLLILYVIDLFWQWFSSENRRNFFKRVVFLPGIFGISLLVTFSPQLYTWNQIDGSLIKNISKALSLLGAEATANTSSAGWWDPFYNLMFGPQWSLVMSSPVWFAGLLGIFISKKYLREIWIPILALIFVFFILVMSTVPPASFGNRYLIPLTGVFALGLGGLLERMRFSTIIFRLGLAFCFIGILAEYFLIVNYRTFLLYNDAEFSLKAFKGIGDFFSTNSKGLLRSTNFVRLIFNEKNQPWSIEDFLMLVLFPLLQGTALWLVLFKGKKIKRRFSGISKNLVLPIVTILVLLGLGTVGIMAPRKTVKEIKNRNTYLKVIKLSENFERKGKRTEALSMLEKASLLVPNIPSLYLKMAILYELQGNQTAAEGYFRKFLSVFSKNDSGWYYLGNFYYKDGRMKEAEACLKEAIRWGPYNKVSFDLLARISSKLNKLREADRFFQIALALDDGFGEAHLNFASFLAAIKQDKPSLNHLKRAVELGMTGPKVDRLLKYYKITIQKIPSP